MIRTLDSSQYLTTLSGGRAPGCWRRDLSRETWRLTEIRRSNQWVEDLVNFDLRLSDQPLLGRTLAALMAQDVAQPALPAEPAPSRARFSEPAPFRKRELKTSARAGSQRSFAVPDGVNDPRRGSTPGSNPPDATREVLKPQPQVETSSLRSGKSASELQQREVRDAAGPSVEPGRQRSIRPSDAVSDASRDSAPENLPDSTQEVLKLQPQADASLLRRIAAASELFLKEDSLRGGDGLDEGTNDRDAIARPTQFSSTGKRQQDDFFNGSLPREKTQLPPASFEPRASVAPFSHFENTTVAQRAAQRVETALRRVLSAYNSSLTTTAKDKGDRLTWLALADNWSIPLNGPNASVNLLLRSANLSVLGERGMRRETEREITRSDSSHTGAAQPTTGTQSDHRLNSSGPLAAHQPIAHAHSQSPQESSWTRPPNETWPAPADEVFEPPASSVLAEPLRSTANDADLAFPQAAEDRQTAASLMQATKPSIAPPSLTPSLLPLHPPRTSGEEVLPVAVITAQRDARADEITARGDDLTQLAARIERILNDEARRHGIDV